MYAGSIPTPASNFLFYDVPGRLRRPFHFSIRDYYSCPVLLYIEKIFYNITFAYDILFAFGGNKTGLFETVFTSVF